MCNLASIALNRFILPGGKYDFKKLGEVTCVVTRNLNKIIDVNYYPVPEAEKSNKRHRPIGIGVQVPCVFSFFFFKLSLVFFS